MTPNEAKVPVENFRTKTLVIATALSALESYHVRHLGSADSREYVVNVKRHDDHVDLGDVIALIEGRDGRELSEGAKTWLREQTDMEQIWASWLEVEREYVVQGLFGGMTLSSDAFWEGVKEEVQKGEDTRYPQINELKTQEDKVKLVEQWHQQDALAREYLQILNRFEPGWCGRQGGYFYLGGAYPELEEYASDIQLRFDALDECIESMAEVHLEEGDREFAQDNAERYYYEQMEELIKLHQEYDNLATAFLWFMKTVDDYNKGLDFQAEVLMRVEDGMDEAKHMGILVYADEVEKAAREKEAQDNRTHEISTLDERDKWGGQLYRYNDSDGDLISLLFYPTGAPGHLGESEQFFIELAEPQGVAEFAIWLEKKRQQCIKDDSLRREEELEEAKIAAALSEG